MPDWLFSIGTRHSVPIPDALRTGNGLRLVQAFYSSDDPSCIPVDQVLLTDESEKDIALVLPPGQFVLRTIDEHSNVLADEKMTVR